MQDGNNNYSEEIKPLIKLLRTEAFRFVLVYFNHYSLLRQLKEDLRNKFPDRPYQEIDGGKTTYRDMVDAYYKLQHGIFFIDNFEGVLEDTEKYTGLNLRRDKLATFPIAMICAISPGSQALRAKEILVKMPDLWSFRSLMIDLKTEVQINDKDSLLAESRSIHRPMTSLGGFTEKDKLEELARLKSRIASTSTDDIALLQALYKQIKEIQTDLGMYDEAIEVINYLKQYATEEELGELSLDEGILYSNLGNYAEAEKAVRKSISIFENLKATEYFAQAYQELAIILSIEGNNDKAIEPFITSYEIQNQLSALEPENLVHKSNLALAAFNLGTQYLSIDNYNEAKRYLEHLQKLSEDLFELQPQNHYFKSLLARSYGPLGDVYLSLKNIDKALQLYEKGTHEYEELCKRFPAVVSYRTTLVVYYERLGDLHENLGNANKKLIYYKASNKLRLELANNFPQNVNFKYDVAKSDADLGHIHEKNVNFLKAASYYANAEMIYSELIALAPENKNFQEGFSWLKRAIKRIKSKSL